jgi:thymidylate synthase (FAD)
VNLIKANYKIRFPNTPELWLEFAKIIEEAGRNCYRSEDKITDDSYTKMLPVLIKNGHESPLEHSILTVVFDVDKPIQTEIVRHRLAAYSIESTRYVDYSKKEEGIRCIEPCDFDEWNSEDRQKLIDFLIFSEKTYFDIVKNKTPQKARTALPFAMAGKIYMSANWREWRWIFKMRTHKSAHPDIIHIMNPLLEECKRMMPCVFGDINTN